MRAARALLSWHQDELAKKAEIGLAILQHLERGQGVLSAHVSTVVKLKNTLEKAGVRSSAMTNKAASVYDSNGKVDHARGRIYETKPVAGG